jgi:hypothetical protein
MKPNFLVAGVAKSGTTSLFYYLIQHPDISIPKKETFYFIREFYANQTKDEIGSRDTKQLITTTEAYNNLYAGSNTKAIGEVSTCYLHFPEMAIPEIKKTLGDPAILIILRNPVDRAYSGYKHFIRMQRETLSFEEGLKAEAERKNSHWDFMWQYAAFGFYAKQVKAFQENFSKVKVILNEDLENNPTQVMQDIFKFIGVDDQFIPDTKTRFNISDSQANNFWFKYFIKNKFAKTFIKPITEAVISPVTKRKIVHMLRTPAKKKKEDIDLATRNKLHELYRNDTLELQQLIGRDLSSWLKK